MKILKNGLMPLLKVVVMSTAAISIVLLPGCIGGIGSDGIGSDNYYEDIDGDGFGAGDAMLVPESDPVPDGYVGNNADCDDTNADMNPDAIEVPDNGVDEDCNGMYAYIFYEDNDADGFGDADKSSIVNGDLDASPPIGYVTNAADCNDDDAAINPIADEITGNGIDDNCNGDVDIDDIRYIDNDGDGYGSTEQSAADGVFNSLDCDDTDSSVHPYAREIANDGLDSDCDGDDN